MRFQLFYPLDCLLIKVQRNLRRLNPKKGIALQINVDECKGHEGISIRNMWCWYIYNMYRRELYTRSQDHEIDAGNGTCGSACIHMHAVVFLTITYFERSLHHVISEKVDIH